MRQFLLYCVTALLFVSPLFLPAQNALHFDGSNDVVQTTFPGVLGANNRTFEAWVFVDVAAPAANLCIMDYGLNAVGSRNSFSVSGNRGLVFISGGTNANISSTPNVVPVGQWTHVAFVLNAGVGFLYVDGQQVGTGSLTTVNTPSGNSDLRIGQRVSGGSIPFEGAIDEVRVWDVARTQQQIQGDTARELCLVPTGLVAYYRFNQGLAGGNNAGVTTATEDVAGNDGTLNNFALSGSTSNWVSGKALAAAAPVMANDTVAACESYTSPSGNYTWTSTGVYTDTIINPAGCDTIMTIDLTILDPSTGTFSTSSCDSVISPSGNYVYYSTGSYLDTIPNAAGCDSVITVNVTIPVIDDSVTVIGNDLTAFQSGATYQWLDCDAGFAAIAGAVAQTYTISSSGNYAVSIQLSGCIDTSDCVLAFFVGLDDNASRDLLVYPNPADTKLSISSETPGGENAFDVYDLRGKLMYSFELSDEKHEIDISGFPNGIYMIRSQGGEIQRKVTIIH